MPEPLMLAHQVMSNLDAAGKHLLRAIGLRRTYRPTQMELQHAEMYLREALARIQEIRAVLGNDHGEHTR